MSIQKIPHKNQAMFSTLVVLLLPYLVTSRMKDWLINVINISATVKKTLDGNPVLTIGLSCALSMHPDFTTIDFYSHEKQA